MQKYLDFNRVEHAKGKINMDSMIKEITSFDLIKGCKHE
jgi:hypothetical protein